MSTDIIDMEQPAASGSGALVAASTPPQLLALAVQQGADLDKLERLMALQERWEADQARKAYNVAFTAFKAEAVTILKNKKVTDGPLKNKTYAELHAVVAAVTPALSRHGLSASWKLTKDEKDWIEVTCYLKHEAGHSESVSMGGPPDTGGAKNAIQARASTKSYLERYTLKAITGLAEQDDDDDGAGGARSGATSASAEHEALVEGGRAAAMNGMASLNEWWGKRLTGAQRKTLSGEFPSLRKAAQAADQGGAR